MSSDALSLKSTTSFPTHVISLKEMSYDLNLVAMGYEEEVDDAKDSDFEEELSS